MITVMMFTCTNVTLRARREAVSRKGIKKARDV